MQRKEGELRVRELEDVRKRFAPEFLEVFNFVLSSAGALQSFLLFRAHLPRLKGKSSQQFWFST